MIVLTPTQAAYIAGFVDGEGSITIRRQNHSRGRTGSYRVIVAMTNRDRVALDWMQVLLGGSITLKKRKNPVHAVAYDLWITSHADIAQLFDAISPYVKIKTRQIAIARGLLALGKMRKTMEPPRGKTWPVFRVDQSEIDVREALKQRIHEINKRGVECPQ